MLSLVQCMNEAPLNEFLPKNMSFGKECKVFLLFTHFHNRIIHLSDKEPLKKKFTGFWLLASTPSVPQILKNHPPFECPKSGCCIWHQLTLL